MTDEETTRIWMALLQAAGIAQAADEQFDLGELAQYLGTSEPSVRTELGQLDRAGLLVSGVKEAQPPMLLSAGRQYLAAGGDVSWEVLHFLPGVIDDLHAREALLHGGGVLVDEFRYQLLHGDAVDYAAAQLVPPAFAEAVDQTLALNLFAASVALMARLSCDMPAGCVAEEIIAVRLIEEATDRLESRCEDGQLTEQQASAAIDELRGLFELFQDDDVLAMFNMREPADAALAGHDPISRMTGVADQRIESWFKAFGGTLATGYITGDD